MSDLTILFLYGVLVELLGTVISENLITASPTHSRRQILDGILEEYDPKISPHYDEDRPTEVSLQLYIHSVDSFNEASMEYALTVFVRQRWEDKRLSFTDFPHVTEPIELDTKIMSRIWIPDLFFTNEKTAAFHLVTVPNKLMHLFRNGTIFYSIRLSMTLTCMMNLKKYPFDTQSCDITAESYGYTTDYLVFRWHDITPVEYAGELVIPQYEKQDTTYRDCTKSYGQAGNFTCLQASIALRRNIWYYVIQVYIPSTLIVILSWVSFWLDVDAIPARITLGVLTVLTLTTQSSSLRATLPKVSYVKAIDVWMAVCMGFVFTALVEFAFVNVLSRRKRREPLSGMTEDNRSPTKEAEDEQETLATTVIIDKRHALCLDKVSRVLFPTVFLTLNLFYWLFYTVILD